MIMPVGPSSSIGKGTVLAWLAGATGLAAVFLSLTVNTLVVTGRAQLGNGAAMGAPTGTPTLVSGAAGNVTGTVRYAYYEIDPVGDGKTTLSPYGEITVTNKQVAVTIPLPRKGAGGRVLCRTKAADTATYYSLQNIGGDYYTTFTDNVLDGSLGAAITNTDTTALYYLDIRPDVKFMRAHPADAATSDLSFLTGNPAVASAWSIDSYGAIVARCASPNYSFYARTYGTAATAVALQVDNLAEAYGSVASTNFTLNGAGDINSNGTATWTNGDCNFKISPASGDNVYVGPTTNSGIFFRTNNAARLGISVDGEGLFPVTDNAMLLGDGSRSFFGMYFTERTAPPAPAANKAIFFCRDNGAGKTQLCVIFSTGAVQVMATEP